MMENIKRRERVKAIPDARLLNMLLSGNQNALQMVLSEPTIEALAAVEETIAKYSGKTNITFYQLGGAGIYDNDSSLAAKGEIIKLASSNSLLEDPAYTQSLIASLGNNNGINNQIMAQLSDTPQKLYDYQLLGIQMQLVHLLPKNGSEEAAKEPERIEKLKTDFQKMINFGSPDEESRKLQIKRPLKDEITKIENNENANIDPEPDITEANSSASSEDKTMLSDNEFADLCSNAKSGGTRQRREAIRALGKMNTQRAINVLLEIINDRYEQYDMIRVALIAISECEINDFGVSLSILQIYSQSPNESVKRACVHALAHIADIKMVDPLIDILKYGSDDEKSSAAYGLAKIGVVPAVNALFDAYNKYIKTNNDTLLSSIIYALGISGDIRANSTLLDALNHSSSYVRMTAAEKLAVIKDAALIGLIREKLNDKDIKVRTALAIALANQGDSSGYQILQQAAEKQDPNLDLIVKRLINSSALDSAPELFKKRYQHAGAISTKNKQMEDLNAIEGKDQSANQEIEQSINKEEEQKVIDQNQQKMNDESKQVTGKQILMKKAVIIIAALAVAVVALIVILAVGRNKPNLEHATIEAPVTEATHEPEMEEEPLGTPAPKMQVRDIVGIWQIGDFADEEFVPRDEFIKFTETEMIMINTGERQPYTLEDGQMVLNYKEYVAAYAREDNLLLLAPRDYEDPAIFAQGSSEEEMAAYSEAKND